MLLITRNKIHSKRTASFYDILSKIDLSAVIQQFCDLIINYKFIPS